MRFPRFASIAGAGACLVASLASRDADAQVAYFGGRVISNVEIVQVSWSANVDQAYMQNLAAYYKAIVVSPFVDWMTEYDTIGKVGIFDNQPGSNQHIGRGTYANAYIINPANGSSQLDDTEIQVELAAQITSGALPMPTLDAGGNVNTLYMIDFPPGVGISLEGIHSCQQFGAYHFTISLGGKSVPYGVHPNCGYDFNTATLIHSHELAEAMSDAEVGLANPNAQTNRPIAWVTNDNVGYEIGDICEGTSDQVAGYTVQKIWSNFAGGCVAQIPICTTGGAPPACRPCNQYDSGAACEGATPACATAGGETGHCVTCTAAFPGACTGATPACDDSTNTCVGCLTNADCKTPTTPVCDLPTKTCRGCASDAECAMGHCDTTADAQKGECVACNTDAQCGANEECHAHACAQKPPADTSSAAATTSGGFSTGAGDPGETADDGDVTGSCACTAAGTSERGEMGLIVLGALAALGARRSRRSRRAAC